MALIMIHPFEILEHLPRAARASELKEVDRGGEYRDKWHTVPDHRGKGCVLEELTVSSTNQYQRTEP